MENKCFRCVTFIIGFTIWALLTIKNWLLSDRIKQHRVDAWNWIKRWYSIVDLGKRRQNLKNIGNWLRNSHKRLGTSCSLVNKSEERWTNEFSGNMKEEGGLGYVTNNKSSLDKCTPKVENNEDRGLNILQSERFQDGEKSISGWGSHSIKPEESLLFLMNLEKFENLTRERNSLDIDEIFKNDDKPSMSRFSGNKKDEGCTLRETWHVEDVTPRDMVEIQIVKSGEISQTDHAERKEVMDGYINETGAMVLGEITKSYKKEGEALHHRNFEREEISKVERKDDSIDLNSCKGTLTEDEICMSCGSHLTKMENGETESVNKGSFEKKYSSLETSDQEIIGTGDLACNDKEVQICEENLCLSEGLEETKIESSEFVESLQGINEESKLFPRVSHEIQYPLGRILLNQRGTVFDTAKGTRYIITTLFGYSILIDVDIDFVHRCHSSLEEKLSNGSSCDGEKKMEGPGEFLSHETILVQHLSDGEEVMFDAVVPTNTSVSSGFRAIVLWQGMKPDSVVSPLENTLIVFRGIEGCCVKINSLQRRCGQINVSFYGREIKVTFYINVVYISGKKCTMQSLRQKHKTHTVYANVYELGNGRKGEEYICSCLWIDEAPQNVETKLLPFTPYVKKKPSLVTEGGHHKKLLLDCPALLCKKIDRTDGTVQICVDSSDTTVSHSPGYFVGIGTIDSQEGKHLFFSLKKDEKAFCFQVPSVFLGIHKEMLEKSTKELLSTVHIIRIVLEEVSHEVAAFQLLACELNRAMKEKGSMVCKEIQKWMVTECGEENITKTERERSVVLEKQEVECQRRKKVVNVEKNCEDTKVREQKEVKSVLKGPHKLKKPWRKEEQDCSEGLECIGGSFKEDTEMTISPQKAETSGEINDQTVFEASVSSLSQASTSSCSSDVSSSDLPCVLWNCKGVIKKVSKSLIIETNWSNENISIKIGKHCNISVNGKLFSLSSLENGFVCHFDAIKEKKWKPQLLWKDVKPSFLVLKTGNTVFYDVPALVVHSDRKSIVLRFYEGLSATDIETDIPNYMYTTHGSHIPKIQAGMWVIVHLNREMLNTKITVSPLKWTTILLLVPEEEELTNRLHTFNADHVFNTMFFRVSFHEALKREEFLYHETKMKMIGEEKGEKHREMTMCGEQEQIFNEVNVRVKKDCPANENEEKVWTGKQKYFKTANVDLAEKVNSMGTNVVHDRLGVHQGARVDQCEKMKAHVGDKVEVAKGKCRDVSLNTRELEEEMRKQVQRSEQGQHKHTSEGEQEGESKERKSREIIKEKKTEIQRMQEEMVKQNIDKKEVHTAEREQHTLKNEIFKDEQEMHKQKQKVQDTQNQERKHAEDRKQFEEKKEDSNQQMKLVSFMAEKPLQGHYKDRKIKEEIQRSKEVEVITKLEEKQNQEEERKRKNGEEALNLLKKDFKMKQEEEIKRKQEDYERLVKEERQPKISIQEEDVGKQEEEICRKQNESNMKEILWWKCKDVRKECQQRKKNEENKKKEGSLGEDMIKLKNKQGKDDISDTVKENVDGELGEFWKVKSGTEIDGEKLVAPAVAETFDKTCIKLADNQSLTNLPGTSFTQCMTQGSSSNSSQASSPDRTEIYCSRPADQGRSATSSVHTQTEMFPLPYGGVQPISPPLYIHPPYFPYHPISHSVPPMVWRTSSPVNHNTSLIPKINAERFPLPLPPYIHPAYFPYHPLGVTPSMVWGTSSSGRHNASLIPSNNVNPTEIEKKKLDIKTNETQCMICKWVTYYDSLQCAILWTEQDLPILFIWHSSVLSNRKSLKDFLVSVDSEVQVETTQLKTSVNVLGYEVSHVALITWCGVVPENKDFLVRRAMQGFPILMSSNPLQFTSMGMNHFEESDNREQHVGECTEDFVIGKIVHFSECMALVRCNITNDKVANASFTLEDVEAEYRRVPGLELELENMFQVYGMIWKCDIKATNPWVCSKIWVTYKTLKVRPNDSQVPLAILNPINKAISCVKCHTLIIKESFGVLQSEEKLIFFTWNICKDFDCIEWKATSVTVQALVVKLKVCVEFLGHKIQWIALQVGLADTLTYEDAERTLDTLPWTVWSFFPLKLTHNRYTKANQHLSFPSSLVSRPVPQTEVSCTQISEGDTRSRANTQGYVHTLCRNSVILMCVMNSENILVQMTKGAVTINGNKCPPGKKFVTWIAEHKSLIFSCTVNKVKEFKVNSLKVSYCAVEAWNGFSEGEPKTVGHYCKIPYNLASCTSAANVKDVSENSFQQQDFELELLSPIGTAEDEPDMVEIK